MKRLKVLLSILLLSLPFTAVAQVDFCDGNFDYDRDQDGTDAFVFKNDFGRGRFNRPCPGGFAAVAKTGSGQAQNLYGWDDGCLQEGVPSPNPRFTDHGNGTVTDNLTGLMWTKNADYRSGMMTWTEAMDWVTAQYNLTCYAGYCDWVLPNVRQLASLIDYGRYNPALPSGHPFTNVQSDLYWSSSTEAFGNNVAWLVDMGSGYVLDYFMNDTHYVWPVRGGYDFKGKCAWE